MGIDLRGLDVRMAQQLLHGAQVLGGLQQVAGEGVAQHVGVQVLPQLALTRGLDPQLDGPGAEAAAFLADEQGAVRRVAQGPQWQPQRQGLAGFAAHRQDPGLAALAMDLHHAIGQVQLRKIQAGQLGQAQSAGIEQLQDGLVAVGQEVVFHRAIEQLQGAVGIQGLGQSSFAFGRGQAIGRIVIA